MKTFFYILTILFVVPLCSVYTQEKIDVIYLKNGKTYKGTIIENVINKYVRIELQSDSIVKINYSRIVKIEKEDVSSSDTTESVPDEKVTAPEPTVVKSPQVKISPPVVTPPPNVRRTNVYIMPLGFLEFGPVLGAEYAVDSQVSIGAHLRIPSLGLLTYPVFSSRGESADEISGLGIGADIKFYSKSVNEGWYFGGILEYDYGSSTYSQNDPGEWINSSKYIAIVFPGGYKFDLSPRLYLNVGAEFGCILNISSDPTVHPNDHTNTSNWNQGQTTIFGMLDLTLGINL